MPTKQNISPKKIILYMYLMTLPIFPAMSSGHPGKLDRNGGHYNQTTGQYHCHQKSCSVDEPQRLSQQPENRQRLGSNTQKTIYTGIASVIDADTIEIQKTRIRLYGIDAPESRQLCYNAHQKPYHCGQQAALALADFIGKKTVQCHSKSRDRYQRVIAICYLGTIDLNNWLVQQGYALAYRQYSKDYVNSENMARKKVLGIWKGTFDYPWEWRKKSRNH